MRVVTTVMCVFAAFILMATPVIACCITGHVDNQPPITTVVQTNVLPCHDNLETSSNNCDSQSPEKYCSSYNDCMISTTNMADFSPAIVMSADLDFVALSPNANLFPRPEIRLLQSTAPPSKRAIRPVDSLISSTDTLLI